MSKTNALENSLLLLLFNADPIAGLAEDDTSSPVTDLYFSLHTTWPAESGDQTSGEVSFGSYARVAVARDNTGFTVTGNSVSPAAAVDFPAAASGSATANFFGVGTDPSGAGTLLYRGVIGADPTIVTGATSDTITSPAHGLAVNDPVVLWPVYGLALPTGITEGTIYYVKTAPDANTFTLSATLGGSTLDITAVGVGAVQKVTPIAISAGVTASLATTTTIKED